MKPERFKRHMMRAGATLVGVGDVEVALPEEIGYLKRAVSMALDRSLNAGAVTRLMALQREAERWLKGAGYRFLSIPPDSDRRKGKFISRLYDLFSHKTGATCSGLGWVGKNGLVINERYGPKLSWATVLTDAPFEPDDPIESSLCGECDYCVRHCPSGAITGNLWSLEDPYRELVRYERCKSLKQERHLFEGKPNCGLCVTICPYSRQGSGPGKNQARLSFQEDRG